MTLTHRLFSALVDRITITRSQLSHKKSERVWKLIQADGLAPKIMSGSYKMTYEALEKDLNEIIEDTRNQIEAEEKTAKSANYPLLKERLAQAIKIKEDISEAEKYGMNGDSFKYEIMQLKEPIY